MEGQPSGQPPPPTPLPCGALAICSQPSFTCPRPNWCECSHTPGTSSNVSGPLCSCVPGFLPLPHPRPQESLWKADWMEIDACASPSLFITPPVQALSLTHAHTHTHSHTHTQRSMARCLQRETQTAQLVQFCLYSETLNSWPLTPNFLPKGSLCWVFALGLLLNPTTGQPQGRPCHCCPGHPA